MLVEALKVAREDVAYIPIHQQPVAWAMRDNVELPQFPDEYVRLWFANIK
jgi:peptide/nickel transport system substrate-binding protein